MFRRSRRFVRLIPSKSAILASGHLNPSPYGPERALNRLIYTRMSRHQISCFFLANMIITQLKALSCRLGGHLCFKPEGGRQSPKQPHC